MTRRLQLLDAESQASGRSASAVIGRIRDGLLRDNKVVPAVLGVLALLIFAWLVAGAVIGGPGDEEQQQASNQASLAQGDDSDSEDSETPAPGVENRDSDASYGGYDEGPKDPFRQIIPKADEGDGGGTQNGQGGSQDDDEDNQDGGGDRDGGSGDNGGGGDREDNGGRGGNGQNGGGDGDDEEDFIEQRSPNDPNSRSNPGGDAGQGDVAQGGAAQGGAAQDGAGRGGPGQGGVGQDGGGLFNSGGDLPAP